MKRLVLVITLAIVISLSNSKVVATTQPDLNAITSIEHSRGFISKLGDIWSGWRGTKVVSATRGFWGNADIPIEKIRDYLLNPNNPQNSGKAAFFKTVLGYDQSTSGELINNIQSNL